MAAIHDDTPDDETIEIVVPSASQSEPIVEFSDPFSKSIEKLKDYQGLSATTKRRLSRHMQKSISGMAGEDKPLAVGKGNSKSKARIDKFATGYGAFDVVEPPYNLDYLAKIYEISPAHKAAVDAKVTNTVGLGYEFLESSITHEKMSDITGKDQLEKARRKITRARLSLERWLEEVNSEEPFLETLRKFSTDYEALGNGYLEIGRTTTGEIGYIGHLPASTIRRRVEKDGYVQIVAGRATFFRNYGERDVKDPIGEDSNPNEILHIMKYSPTNSYYGVPDVVAAKNAIAGEEFASRFNLDYFEHKAVPRYIVLLKNARLSAQSEKRLVDFLQTGLRGQNHRTVYIPLPADSDGKQVEFKLVPVEANITDASFTKYHEQNRDEILLAHRTPLPQVGISAGLSMGASKDAARMFKEQVCRPIQDVIEKKVQQVFKEKTNIFDFHLKELTLTDEDTSSRINERMLRWDVISPNEVRESIGLPPTEDGDSGVGIMSQAKEKVKADSKRTPGMGPQGQLANQTRVRDAERSGGPDTAGSDRTRNSSGEGRQVG
jgi:PBSX family phage portal protein